MNNTKNWKQEHFEKFCDPTFFKNTKSQSSFQGSFKLKLNLKEAHFFIKGEQTF